MIPGEVFYKEEKINGNVGRETITVKVKNTDKRPVAVGSHMHFFEVNRFLDFDREATYGYKLDIPSGRQEMKRLSLWYRLVDDRL